MQLLRILSLLSIALLLSVSLVILSLGSHILAFIHDPYSAQLRTSVQENVIYPTETYNSQPVPDTWSKIVSVIPLSLKLDDFFLSLGVSAVGVLAAIALFVLWLRKSPYNVNITGKKTHSLAPQTFAIALSVLICILGIAAIAYTTDYAATSGQFGGLTTNITWTYKAPYRYQYPNVTTFTFEGFTCDLARYAQSNVTSIEMHCAEAKAARFLLVPYLLSPILLILLALLTIRRDNILSLEASKILDPFSSSSSSPHASAAQHQRQSHRWASESTAVPEIEDGQLFEKQARTSNELDGFAVQPCEVCGCGRKRCGRDGEDVVELGGKEKRAEMMA